jgi:hypothetical protein
VSVSARHAARGLALVAGAYVAALVVRYFLPPHVPRHQVESAFMIFAALGVLSIATRRGAPRDPAPRSAWTLARIGIVGGLFLVLALAMYARAMGIGLLSDDFVIADWAIRREFVHLGETGFVRPGVPLFWAALDRLPGRLDIAVHAANVALHAVNALLVVLLGRRMRLSPDEAIAAGVLFLLQPALGEAVVWASGAQDVLMTTLCLAAVLTATSDRRGAVAAAMAASAGALAVKETAVIIPVLVALILWARGAPLTSPHARRVLVPLAVLTAGYALVRAGLGLPSAFLGADDWRYFAKQLIVGPFAALGAPWSDQWGRAHAVLALVRSLVIMALFAAGFATWGRRDPRVRQVAAAAVWVVAGIVPVFSLFYVGPDLEGSRYVYLSAAGFALLLAGLAGTAAEHAVRWPRRVALAVVILAMTAPVMPAITADIDRWQTAAVVRDAVLIEADRSPALARCATFRMEGDADHVRGGFVFRNGFAQALAGRRGQQAASAAAGSQVCTVRWSNGRLSVE